MSGGGSERQLLNLLRGLDRKRFQPILYLLYREGELLSEVPNDVPIHAYWERHKRPKWNWPGRIHRTQVADLRTLLMQQQIDVTYDRLFHMAMLTGPATRNSSIARVSTIVSPPSRDLPHSGKRFLWIKRSVLRRAFQEAQRVLAVSRGTADDATRFYRLAPNKVEVLPSPTDIARIDLASREDWTGLPLDPEQQHIISIGRLSDEKGHADLLRAFELALRRPLRSNPLPLHLHLVGDGPEMGTLQSLSKDLRIDDRVTFHGHLRNPYALLARCQLLCLPSKYEGLPNVLLEAIACGVPFVSTRASESIVELMQATHQLPLAETGDVEQISNLIVDRFTNNSRWTSKLQESRRYLEHHHSLQAWIETMQTILENAIERKTVRRFP